MQTKINISQDVLKWIVAHSQTDSINKTVRKYLDLWQSKTPTFNQIEKVSKATGIPLGYFFLKKPPMEDLSLLEYRTIDSLELQNPSRNLIDTIHDMERIQDWMRNYLHSKNEPRLYFVGSSVINNNPEVIVKSIRNTLNIEEKWFEKQDNADESFKYLRSLISNLGIIIMMNGIVSNNTHRTLEIDEFRAFTLVDEYAPLIFINSNDSINGKLFSLLHELAHIWLGINNFFNDRYSIETKVKKSEKLCNAVAAEILVPQTLFLKNWRNIKENDIEIKIAKVSHYFKCGYTVIARKALDNNLLSYELYNKIARTAVTIYNEKRKRDKEKDSGGNYYRTLANRIDQRFLGALYNSLAEGKTLYSDAFRLTNTNRTTFANLIDQIRGDRK